MYAIVGGHHAKDAAMDLMISSSLAKSTLLHSSKSSDYALRLAENTKFNHDLRNVDPLQSSSTQRFIPLVMNQCDRRRLHFEAKLLEYASSSLSAPLDAHYSKGPL